MTELLTAAQMRAIEQAAIASGEVTGLELMERAGQGVVDAIYAEWPAFGDDASAASGGAAPRVEREASLSRSPGYREKQRRYALRAVVLCGPGNNGGDGFVVARLLKEAGWAVEVFLYGDAGELPPDAWVNYERWGEMGEVKPMDQCFSDRWLQQPLVVDAVFGTGLTRPIPSAVMNVLMATLNCRRVAIDLPSMLSSDTGQMLNAMPSDFNAASLTVTFHLPKRGHFVGEGPDRCGELRVVDIGLGSQSAGSNVSTVTYDHELVFFEKIRGHKYSHGHALILSGGVGEGGAARLAARGALRIGAGVATLGCPPAALIENATQLTAIMLRKVADAAALAEVLADDRINAVCVGPGLGLGAREAALVDGACEHAPYVVLDADALTMLARKADPFAPLHKGCVLTPHAGEFARLFPDIAEKLDAPATKGPAYSKVDATREAAQRAGCVVLFKGPDTVIADPEGRCSINASVYERSAPWLATAGSGDVLAGFITGLLARGFSPMQAAETGAWLHTECALQFGSGLIAEDLPEVLPQVFRDLGIT